jgi:predicted dehydrogenase
MNKHPAIFIWLLSLTIILGHSAESKIPVKFAIVGLSHDHARGFIPSARSRDDVHLVGIVGQDRELAARYAKNFKLSTNLFHSSLEELIKKTNVQAVATFTSTFDHRRVVEERLSQSG